MGVLCSNIRFVVGKGKIKYNQTTCLTYMISSYRYKKVTDFQYITGVDSEKTCQDQPEQSQPCIRETIEGCKTCTHWTYINKCIAVSGEGECSLYNFDSTTGHCKNAGGWRCYEPIDDNSGKLYSLFKSAGQINNLYR